MGLFDDVHVPCPACGTSEPFKALTYQTKGGVDPQLCSIALADATPLELADIDGDTQTCRTCGAAFTARVAVSVTFTLDRAPNTPPPMPDAPSPREVAFRAQLAAYRHIDPQQFRAAPPDGGALAELLGEVLDRLARLEAATADGGR